MEIEMNKETIQTFHIKNINNNFKKLHDNFYILKGLIVSIQNNSVEDTINEINEINGMTKDEIRPALETLKILIDVHSKFFNIFLQTTEELFIKLNQLEKLQDKKTLKEYNSLEEPLSYIVPLNYGEIKQTSDIDIFSIVTSFLKYNISLINELDFIYSLTSKEFLEYKLHLYEILILFESPDISPENLEKTVNKYMQVEQHYNNIIKNNQELKDIYLSNKIKIIKKLKDPKNINKTENEPYLTYETEVQTMAPEGKDFWHNPRPKSVHIIFQINKNCNFKCTYCYEGLDKVTEIIKHEDIDGIIKGLQEFMNEMGKEENGGYTHIDFSILGGEPTLVKKEVTQELTYRLANELPLHYMMLITNFYDKQKVQEFFHPEIPVDKIRIQVSYDGGLLQDKFRLNGKREGTKTLVQQNVISFITDKNNPHRQAQISLKATLPYNGIDDMLDAVQDYLYLEEEYKKYGAKVIYYPTFDNTSLLALDYKKQFQEYMNNSFLNKTQKSQKLQELENKMRVIFQVLLDLEVQRNLENKEAFTRWFREASYTANNTVCSIGQGGLAGLDQTGQLRGCHRTEYDIQNKPEYSFFDYGNIKENANRKQTITKYKEVSKNISDILNSKEYELENPCNYCNTLTCVKCPMVAINNTQFKQNKLNNPIKDIFSSSDDFTCSINGIISEYLYIYLQLLYNKR